MLEKIRNNKKSWLSKGRMNQIHILVLVVNLLLPLIAFWAVQSGMNDLAKIIIVMMSLTMMVIIWLC